MELNKIYNQDCLEFMATLPDNSVDLIVTSPPYNKNAHLTSDGDWGTKIKYDTYDDNLPQEEYEDWQRRIISECLRILKPSGSLFYNHKDRIVNNLIISPMEIIRGFPLHQQIIWDRGGSVDNNPRYFSPCVEYIYWLTKDSKKFYFSKEDSIYKSIIWRISPTREYNPHPAPFPLYMAENIVKSACPPNGVVYDPFMGSGTTALATIRVGGGRSYIGSEISPKYIKMAEDRIGLENSQLSLF